MINNYIKNLTISDHNNYIIIYFKNNIFNIDGGNLTQDNFTLDIKINNIYSDITIDTIIKNDNVSYTLFFKLDNFILVKNANIFIKLLNVINFEYKYLNTIQYDNYIYIKYVHDIVQDIKNNKMPTTTPIDNYINKSSPILAYRENKKKYYESQINNYPLFYGTIIPKYPKSYYHSSYKKIHKPV